MQINLVLALLEPKRTKRRVNELLARAGGQMSIAAASTLELPERVAQLQPDVLLLEHVPREISSTHRVLDGARACSSGALRILLMCDRWADSTLLEAVCLGAHGCIASDLDSSMLAKAVQCVAVGQVWFPREWMLRQLCDQAQKPMQAAASAGDQGEKLTAREREIVALIGSGMTNKEIARRLNISDKTVQTQLHRIYTKLHARGRYKAFAIWQGQDAQAIAAASV